MLLRKGRASILKRITLLRDGIAFSFAAIKSEKHGLIVVFAAAVLDGEEIPTSGNVDLQVGFKGEQATAVEPFIADAANYA